MNFSSDAVISKELAHVYAMFEGHAEMQKWFNDMALAVCADLKGITPDHNLFARILADKGRHCFEGNFDVITSQISKLDPSFKIACVSGCSYCCYSHITVSPQEAFSIALHLAENFDAGVLEEIVAACAKESENFHCAGLQEFSKKYFGKCPFLKDNKCLIYEVRPIACRNWISHDLKACSASFKSENSIAVPQNAMIMIQKDLIFAGQHTYLANLGINGHIASLLPLMQQILLDYEGTYARWLAGETLPGQMDR
ncbi:YkgJ family cysteine cluster protein [Desulfovibrio gilichinskyi]|uniref:Putative zinc-or iron-chelating domain-containing protein n=1 Tax=Desulfovibrio gilichinskyi TaxID=1519643 RepID=A0A1X7DJ56_9BACT|nr:YkgJ family cysteine cluster protein [Desulfovibrio gilichinskyi]SMF16163.1 Putative zinc-or iron-chelating domain-containing protein [Desulfovibrio gilichinskyi]